MVLMPIIATPPLFRKTRLETFIVILRSYLHTQFTFSGTGFRTCVRTAKLEHQRLKPHLFCRSYVVAKATTHKDSQVLRQPL